MPKLSGGAAVALLAVWLQSLSTAVLSEALTPEPLVVSGTRGSSIAHARIHFGALARESALAERGNQLALEAAPELELPRKALPLPPGAQIRLETRRAEPQAIGAARPPSPPLASSFQALLDDGHLIPPDTDGAVGPNHVVTMLNSQVRVHDRAGRDLGTMTLLSFWTRVSGDLRISDPRIQYDPVADRWFASAITVGKTTGETIKDSSILIGASQNGDPTGTWNLYRVLADRIGAFADFPTLGFNKDWICIQVNMIGYDVRTSQIGFVGTRIYAFDKLAIYAGGSDARHTVFARDDLGSGQAPAMTYDAAVPVLYLLEMWNENLNGKGILRLYSISGPVGSEVLTSIGFPAAEMSWDSMPPGGYDFAPQKDASVLIQAGNSDFTSVVFRNGLITAAHTVFLPAGGSPTRTAVQWWQLTTDGAVVQRGLLDDPTGQAFYAFPSIAPNRNNDLLLGYASFSAQQYAGGGYSFRAAADPLDTLRENAVLKAGEIAYSKTYRGGRNRWGDYSVTAVDPVNDTDLWTIQEYASLPPTPTEVSYWGTWWGRVASDSGPTVALPVAGFLASSSTVVAGQPISFTDTSSGASLWFWNFGDGATSTQRNPTHVFGRSGTFTISQAAVNQTGATTAARSVAVAEPAKVAPRPLGPSPRGPRTVNPRP